MANADEVEMQPNCKGPWDNLYIVSYTDRTESSVGCSQKVTTSKINK